MDGRFWGARGHSGVLDSWTCFGNFSPHPVLARRAHAAIRRFNGHSCHDHEPHHWSYGSLGRESANTASDCNPVVLDGDASDLFVDADQDS